jgi:uncharacterized protein YqeY
MGLKEKLQADLTDAIKARNETKAGTIRMVLAAITTEEVSGKQARVLTDAEIITVLSREAKKRREAIDAYSAANRADLVAKEKSESEVISAYLPEQLSDPEIEKLVQDAISQTGASGPSGMGQVMKFLQPKIAGKADGGKVSAIVKKALGS